MLGVLLSLAAGITYGAADFIGGLASRRSSTFSVVIISQLSGLIVLLAVSPFLPASAPQRSDLTWGLLGGVGGAAGITLLYRGLAIGRMSVVSPVTAVVAAIVPLVVGLALGERPTLIALVGIAIALVAVVLVSSAEAPGEPASNAAPGLVAMASSAARSTARGFLAQPGVPEALLSGVAIGAFYVCLARTHAAAGLWPLACSRGASIALLATLALGLRRPLVPGRGGLLIISFAGVLDMLANALYLIATKVGLLSIVAVLASLYPASTVLLARMVLHERLNRVQLVGVCCALIAVALIAGGT